jgi:hypothetical protein
LEKTRGRKLRKGGCSGLERDSAQLGRCRKQSLLAGAVTLYRSVPVIDQCGGAKNTYVARSRVWASKGQVTTDRPTECTWAWGMQVLLLGEIERLAGGSFAPVGCPETTNCPVHFYQWPEPPSLHSELLSPAAYADYSVLAVFSQCLFTLRKKRGSWTLHISVCFLGLL